MKFCKKCNIEKELIDFFISNSSKDGYHNYCKLCSKEISRIYYIKNKEKIDNINRNYYIENKDDRKEIHIKYRKDNKEKLKNYYETNREKLLYQKKEYYIENKEKIKNNGNNYKDRRNEKRRERRKNDKLYLLTERIRSSIKSSFINNKYQKKNKTQEILGCSFDEFKEYLEQKFECWMTWENHGKYNGELNYGWDIDHIIPSSSAISEEEIYKLNHYTNLQPLCSRINRDIKRNKIIY